MAGGTERWVGKGMKERTGLGPERYSCLYKDDLRLAKNSTRDAASKFE